MRLRVGPFSSRIQLYCIEFEFEAIISMHAGRFPAKLGLLHQHVTGGLLCIVLNYEACLCYYEDD